MPTWRYWGGRKTKTKPFPKWPMYDELEGRAQPHSWQAGFCCVMEVDIPERTEDVGSDR
jgi:hypothetical protein